MNKRYIPVEVYGVKKENRIWYVDISDMSYSQLTELRKELLGTISVRYFDSAFNDEIRDITYKYYNNKQRKRNEKNNNKLIKRKRSSFRRGR